MGVSGVVLLVFLAVHLCDFWYPYKFAGPGVGDDAAGQRDLYGLVVSVLGRGAHAAFYVVAMLALGVHVRHGVYSGFRSLGLYPPGLARVARAAGTAFAALVTACFVAMAVSVFLRQGSV
jgi:succinate dehydrogenase / fumarate reductase cytochrome b subunit